MVLSQARHHDGYIDIVTPALANGTTYALNAKVDGVFAGESTASASHTVTIDTTGPALSITDDDGGTANIADGDVTFTFQFGQGVTGFDADDISVGNGTKGTFTAVDTDTYTLVVTPNAGLQGNITVNVAAGVVTDAAGNGNAVADALQAVDNVRPDATIVVADNNLGAGETSLVTITFTEAVTGFTNDDLNGRGRHAVHRFVWRWRHHLDGNFHAERAAQRCDKRHHAERYGRDRSRRQRRHGHVDLQQLRDQYAGAERCAIRCRTILFIELRVATPTRSPEWALLSPMTAIPEGNPIAAPHRQPISGLNETCT